MIKRIAIAVLIVTVSVAAAYATKGTMRNAWISVRFLSTNLYVCLNTGLVCNETGAQLCMVNVQTIAGALNVNARTPGCVSTMANDSHVSIGIYDPLFGLIVEVR